MRSFVIILFAIAITCRPANADDGQVDNLTTHIKWQPVICFPFVLEQDKRQTNVFANPIIGVKIVSIVADGKTITSADAHTDYDGLDNGVIGTHGCFIYNLCSDDDGVKNTNNWTITSAISINGKGSSIRDFNIPKNTKEILIRYQIRYTDLQLSHEKSVLSTAMNF